MTDKEKQQQRPAIGGIGRQYATIGGAKRTDAADAQTSERLNAQAPMLLDTRDESHPDAKAPKTERKRHTIYLPAELSRWVKHQAVNQDRDISDIVAEAIEQYRAELP